MAAEWAPPSTIDEYVIQELLGRGAMGEVYRAEDTVLERPVAIKFIAETELDADARRRFFVEARAVARLSHPNVMVVHRVGALGDTPYLVSELVQGRNLAQIERPVSPERALHIALGLSRGLAAAHRQGVLHRDIKPENVMLTDAGEVKLLDFGLAKLLVEARPGRGGDSRSLAALQHARASGPATDAGMIIGTPLYMAPEALRSEPATPRADVYSVGTVLYELCTGIAPRDRVPEKAPLEDWIGLTPPSVADVAGAIDPRLAAAIDRCLAVDPAERFASAELLCDAIERIAAGPGVVAEGNPYRGLLPFLAEHRASFFGRTAEARAVVDRLRSRSLVIVAGDSGVGKSSLCRAAVLPLVEEGALGGRPVKTVSLVPGKHPLSALAAALGSCMESDGSPLLQRIEHSPAEVVSDLHRSRTDPDLLLFIDQLEELFTIADEAEVTPFAEMLSALCASGPRTRLLATIRGDFFTRLGKLPRFGEGVEEAFVLLRPLAPEAMRLAIVAPAKQKGVSFESDSMVSALVASALRAPGGLPLLQFAMAEMWEVRDVDLARIPSAALDAIGGVAGALERHADRVMASLSAEQRRAARRILLRLVTAQATRERRSIDELADAPPSRAALEALIAGRLVVARDTELADQDAEGEKTYELAHEALLEGWSTLRRWVEADGGQRDVRRRVETAAAEWRRLGRAREGLFSARQIAETAGLDEELLSTAEVEFLRESRSHARRARIQRWSLFAAVPLAIAAVFGGFRWKAQRDLDQLIAGHSERAGKDLDQGRSQMRRADEHRRRAFEQFDAVGSAGAEQTTTRLTEAERTWAAALDASKEAESALLRATQSLEAAFVLDPARVEVRDALADVHSDRAALAQWFHQAERSQELIGRLGTFDRTGERVRRLTAAPHVAIRTSPPGATVTVERYDDDHGQLALSRIGTFGPTPVADIDLAKPGSYVLTLRADGRVETRYPVLLAAGERLDVEIALPTPSAIPEGFVYVPPGRFLFGSSDPEGLRRGLVNTSPLHELRTGAFLIGRTEVTVGEYLTFLRDLPPDERKNHLPGGSSPSGRILLREASDGGWQYVWGPENEELVSKEGEPVRYGDRDRRAEQDWRKLPVLAVSLDDAVAYAAWLHRTGRVKGARLCTEIEWERAARGADARIFAHGGVMAPDDADFDETYGRKRKAYGPDEVGSHPASASPFGVLDMTGNAYEWVQSTRPGEALFRGGAWYYDRPSAWIPNRSVGESSTRDVTIGFRVCASPSQS